MPVFVACVVLAAGALVWLCLAARARAERRTAARVQAVAARLHPAGAASVGLRLETALARLERAADATVERAGEAAALAAWLRGALEAVPLGVVVAGPAGEVVLRNPAAEEVLGTRASDAIVSRALAELLASAAAGEAVSRPLELYGPPRRTLSIAAVPLGGGSAAVVVEDVSERRRLEAVRRDFVANVSHELKTPVAAVGLLAETMAGEDDPTTVRRLAERIQDEAFRVAKIIDDLLDLSRLEAEEAVRHEPVRVAEVVAAAAAQIEPAATLRSVRLEVVAAPRSWTVHGDRRQLVSALANLLENAVKYSDDGCAVEVRARTDGAAIEVSVRDTGIGIPSRDLGRIFERFYRVDRGRGRDTGGTGLGLSIVRHVASNHGGEVLVESVEGEGSTFTLRLPAAPGPVGLVADAG
ncbi:MAG TPA: ATP-binding protein [Acidimicrobiales bacterium]|nr:ATP-binding protein [Acidimicrobiales bacterium]